MGEASEWSFMIYVNFILGVWVDRKVFGAGKSIDYPVTSSQAAGIKCKLTYSLIFSSFAYLTF
jgi:hypothetical protein